MEVATTNNHNQNHHHHLYPHSTHTTQRSSSNAISTSNGVAAAGGSHSPFQREVREWQRIDPDTGALLTGRLEADRWHNGPLNSYGKISDSQNISQPNGTQHTQRKQLEVLQARTANGAMQVIRAQTVQKTSSRWSSSCSKTTVETPTIIKAASNGCDKLFHNPNFNDRSLSHNHHQKHNIAERNNNHNSTRWQQLSSTVDICEISDDDDDSTDDDVDVNHHNRNDNDEFFDIETDEDQQHYLINDSCSASDISSNILLNRHSFNNLNNNSGRRSDSEQQLQKHSNNHFNSNNCNTLLLDTAPSLKLSNLMKSSSSISSNNSSSNNSIIGTTATTTPSSTTTTINTHKNASKISLHAIVGNSNNNNNDTKSSSLTSAQPPATVTSAKTTSWQHQQQQQQQRSSRLFEQPTLYGNINNSLTKSRVGGGGSMVGDAAASSAADDLRHLHHNHPHQSDELTPTQLNRQQQQQPLPSRRDLESFRHYNNHDHGLFAASSAKNRIDHLHDDDVNVDNDDDIAADDDDMRLTAHHQRRQQKPLINATNITSLQLSRSISNDDLSTEWDTQGDAASDEEPSEWRRVSKLRRSFQSTTTSSTANETYNSSPRTTRRPFDLPTNSVNVSKIRAELENGRRLNTAMRNNHVDLAALDTILNGPTTATETKQSVTAKQTTFLTAESLKEIRGRLKKLSDESLYKEDFLTYQQLPAADEQIVEVQHIKSVPQIPDRRLRLLTPEQSPEISASPKSAFHAVARQQHTAVTPHSNNYQTQRSLPTGGTEREKQHTTNSLESRQKYRDTTSAEWHIRRKSYGFEKMSPPDDKTMFRMDASTDSGLGRSGELGNWSPTESTTAVRGTVVHFGEPARTVNNVNSLVQKRYRQLKSPEDLPEGDEEVHKRHSIAVDESQYVRDNLRKTSQVHLNGFYDIESSKSLQTETSTSSTAAALFQRTQQKRVEFCKTEVHFAAESGRVNIVETDGKPPPTNNFRRRRRTSSGPLQSLVKSASTVTTSSVRSSSVALPITHFGDDHHRRKTIATTMVAYKASLLDAPENNNNVNNALEPSASTNVTVSVVPKLTETYTLALESSRNSYASTSGIDSTTDGENDEISAIRGILKNKPIKPKPYHLGENIDSTDALWGVQLKPIGVGTALINRRDSAPSKPDSPISSAALNKSVAERVRIVEKRQDLTTANGYSTKINLSLDDAMHKDWTEPGAVGEQNLFERRPSAQELLLQDLREHQRILDEGHKSTSLIIKTMRSATEFDEAMRRLSIASMEAAVIPPIVVPTPMLRSNSYQETTRRYSTTSMDGNSNSNERETIGIIKSASCSSSTSTSTTSTISTMRRFSTESYNSFVLQPQSPVPIAAPRLKLLGNTEIPVSQQLSQLRRMYEVAAAQQNDGDNDSADEEVKSYFRGHDNSDSGDATHENSSLEDEHAVEYSSSWSRLKAKRTIWKIEGNDVKPAAKMLERTELPKSNVMSIELHSPQQATLDKQHNAIHAGGQLQRTHTPPVAKPRSIANVKQTEHPQIHNATTVKQVTNHHQLQHLQQPTLEPKDSLKIIKEARGARKLREHELSYFGVPVSKTDITNAANNEVKTTTKILSTNTPKRSLPQRKYIEEQTMSDLNKEKQTTKWQLLNDKPDLLRHSPIAVEPHVITRTADIKPMAHKHTQQQQQTRKIPRSPIKAFESEDEEEDDDSENIDDHFYENITNEFTPAFKVKSLTSYDRKMDLKRDALILSEMTKNADQTMKALSDEAAIKDQRRRSLQRRNSKPLETIEEKGIAEKINDTCIAVKISRSTLASDAKRTARHSNTPSPTTVGGGTSRVRTSSQSSTESCPRARSRSLSSEREYENVKVVRPAAQRSSSASAKQTTAAKLTKKPSNRSNSLESRHSAHTAQYSSGDEICKGNEERLRIKPKRISSSSASRETRGDKRISKEERGDVRKVKHYHQSLKDGEVLGNERQQQLLHRGSTTHSSQRERTECSKPQHHHHHRSSSGGSSNRRRKDEHDALHKSVGRSSAATVVAVATGSRDEKSTGHTSRLVRSAHVLGHERDSIHRSSHRSERAEKTQEKEKDKLMRSKGHSSRSTTAQTNERSHHCSSPHGATDTKKLLREHKTKSAATTKTTPSSDNITHSKNAQIINGQHDGHQREHRTRSHHQLQQHADHQQHHHSHPTTTTTIAAKHRSERHGKDRK